MKQGIPELDLATVIRLTTRETRSRKAT